VSDDLSNKSVLIVDGGQFWEVARRLTREFGKVYFHNPELIEGFPRAPKSAIGKGFPGVEWVEDLWKIKDKVDLFVFVDINNSGIQEELESQGKRVIGSRTGDRLENYRIYFKQVQKKLGLNVPKFVVCEGLKALHEHLKTVEDRYVKISRFRGSMETEHHINYELSQPFLNKLACELGPLGEEMDFIVEEPIKGKVEFGYDGFCFNGQFPARTLFGPEVKSKCYLGAVVEYDELDERLRGLNEAVAPLLAEAGYANAFSSEVRIAEDDKNFADGEPVCIEPSCRWPSPPFEGELEAYGNLGAMLWHGSLGEVIEPEMECKFVAECRITHSGDGEGWRALQIPPETEQWIKLYGPTKIDDTVWLPPLATHPKSIGCMVGMGKTVQEAVEDCKKHLDEMKDQPISSEFDSLADAIKDVQAGEEQGIEFGAGEIPQPAIILETES
jgi:hypothetical protein